MIARVSIVVDKNLDEVLICFEDYEVRLDLDEVESLIRILKLGAGKLKGEMFLEEKDSHAEAMR